MDKDTVQAIWDHVDTLPGTADDKGSDYDAGYNNGYDLGIYAVLEYLETLGAQPKG